MTEKNLTESIQELMYKPEQIRNIGTVAHIDHGKCITGDSRLLLHDGDIMTAKKLFELAESECNKFEDTENHVIYDTTNLNIKIYSLNKKTGKIEIKPIELAWKLNGGNLIRIKLRNGFSIATTPEHKFIVHDNLDFVEKEAKNIKLGDRIVCSRKLDAENNVNIKKEILLILMKKRFYVRLKPQFGEEIKNLILSLNSKNVAKKINTSLKLKSLYHGSWQYRYLLSDIINLSKILNVELENLYDNIETIIYRTGGKRGKSSNSMRLPQNFESFYYLVGLLTGDGSNKKFIVGKEELGKKFTHICSELSISLTFRNYGYRTPEIVTNQTLVEILNSLFDYPIKRKSYNIKISEFLLRSPKEYSSKFLRGYFDTDGSVEKSRRAITISSASNRMIEDLSLFLLRFGCIPIIEKDNTISLSGTSLINFIEKIGFNLEEKLLKAEFLAQGISGSLVSDKIPISVSSGNLLLRINDSKKATEVCENYNIPPEKINKFFNPELAFIEVKSLEVINEEFVYDFTVPDNHNFVAEGMFIHNTTFSDNLLSGAGMISEELAGKQLFMDFDPQEQERGITIWSANASMIHKFKDKNYLVNLIDTPGHVDFGGDVTRAMRAVDGAIVLVDAVETIMPQTETVLRQALRERVKPVLFINKVDRLIRELKLTPDQIQERFMKIISEVNYLIQKYVEEEFKEKWLVNVENGSVTFGSALRKWGISVPYMKNHGITFKDIIDLTMQENDAELSKKAPLHRVVLDMIITHLPSPLIAQKYRIAKIWKGDLESDVGKNMIDVNPNGILSAVVTKLNPDPHAGYVATARIFSGKMTRGQEVYLIGQHKKQRIQQVSVYKGPHRIQVEEVVAGNIVGIVGLAEAFSGETICDPEHVIESFEQITHIFEPVVTKAIEPKKPQDLNKLIIFLKKLEREDTTIKVKIDEETGEYLVSGLGELHLDAKVERKLKEQGLEVETSPPVVVYRETISAKSQNVEGKSPNKHNKFYMYVEPMDEKIGEAMSKGEISSEVDFKKKHPDVIKKLMDLGMSAQEVKNIWIIYNKSMFVDATKGIQYLNEAEEMLKEAFKHVMDEGPLTKEQCTGIKVTLYNAELHEDPVHRGPGQVLPAIRWGIMYGILQGNPVLLEPKQIIRIDVPGEVMGGAIKEIQNRRGQILEMEEDRGVTMIKAKLPVIEMFGFNSALKSATGGKGFYSLIDVIFERLPKDLQDQTIKKIRKRKGLPEELPKPE